MQGSKRGEAIVDPAEAWSAWRRMRCAGGDHIVARDDPPGRIAAGTGAYVQCPVLAL